MMLRPLVLPRWLESWRRYPLTDVRSGLDLPGLANQKFTLIAVGQGFDLLLDAQRFLRQALVTWVLVGLGTRHNWLS